MRPRPGSAVRHLRGRGRVRRAAHRRGWPAGAGRSAVAELARGRGGAARVRLRGPPGRAGHRPDRGGIGLLAEDGPAGGAEWDLLLRAARRAPIVNVDQPLVRVLWRRPDADPAACAERCRCAAVDGRPPPGAAASSRRRGPALRRDRLLGGGGRQPQPGLACAQAALRDPPERAAGPASRLAAAVGLACGAGRCACVAAAPALILTALPERMHPIFAGRCSTGDVHLFDACSCSV